MSLIPTKKPVNYLNNKDILKEIHESKTTYCYFTKQEYHRYDYIVDMPHESLEKSFEHILKPESIQLARENRAARLSVESGTKISPDDISVSDLVFRVMTWEHIPLSQKQPRKTVKKKTAKDIFEFEEPDPDEIFADLEDTGTKDEDDDMVHVRVNFPPFQHFRFNDQDELVCVGKSHWKGSIDKGHFSKDHGRITENLGRMFITLSERYAQRSNWRGYTYIDEMKGQAILQLSQIGLQFDESKSENPFAYYTAAVTNSFTRILNLEKKNQNIRDDLLEENGLTPSLTRQNQHEYAEETARQAELYKNMRMPKSEETDPEEEFEDEETEA